MHPVASIFPGVCLWFVAAFVGAPPVCAGRSLFGCLRPCNSSNHVLYADAVQTPSNSGNSASPVSDGTVLLVGNFRFLIQKLGVSSKMTDSSITGTSGKQLLFSISHMSSKETYFLYPHNLVGFHNKTPPYIPQPRSYVPSSSSDDTVFYVCQACFC